MDRYRAGDHVVLRAVHEGAVWSAMPLTVVRADAELAALYYLPGTRWKTPADSSGEPRRLPNRPWILVDNEWVGGGALRLSVPGERHSVMLFWTAEGVFRGWYINIEEPLQPSPIGYDFMDNTLDIVAAPDRSWRWKDEDELAEAVELGVYTQAQAKQFRRDGERAIETLESNGSPFCDGWEKWTPDPSWVVPTLPAGWDSAGLP